MSGSIRDRMTSQLKFLEKQLWNALCHSGEDILPYLSKNTFRDTDSVFIFSDGLLVGGKDVDRFLKEAYGKKTTRWMTYEMDDAEVLECDLMVGVIYYPILAGRMENGKLVQYKLACTSTWRQNADGEYTITSHTQTRIL